MTIPGSQNRRILKQIDDLIEGKAAKDIQYYQIHGRSLNKMEIKDLLHWKSVYTNLVLAEQGHIFGSVTFE